MSRLSVLFIASGARLVERVVASSILLAVVGFISAAITFPLWFLSTRAPRLFSVSIAAVSVCFAGWAIFSVIRRRLRAGNGDIWTTVLRPLFRRAFSALGIGALAYLAFTFFAGGSIVPGILSACALFALLTLVRMGPRRAT